MTDLQAPTFSPLLSVDSLQMPETDVDSVPQSWDQTILKLTESAYSLISEQAQAVASGTAMMSALTETDMKSIYRLMYTIEQVRSPENGWPDDQLPTPETLLPYVEDEAQDVLTRLQGYQQQNATQLPITTTSSHAEQIWDGYFTVRLLAPWLIWCTVRASYVVMQLMEGIVASVSESEQVWQTGIFRLAPVLALETNSQTLPIDLATGQLIWPQLPNSASVQSEECQLCRESVPLGDLMQELMDQIQRMTPELVPLIQGLSVNALVPGQVWQTGQIRLHLTAEFIVDADDLVIDRMLESETLNAIAEVGLITPDLHAGTPVLTPMRQPLIRLTDDQWLERYIPTLIREALIREPAASESSAIARPNSLLSMPMLTSVVSDAWQLNDSLRDSLTSSSYDSLYHSLRLSELVTRLMWCVGRSAYAVMQLMGGVRARVLQPKVMWMSGTLRLLVNLDIQTPELNWEVDIATGRSPHSDAVSINQMAIVQSAHSQWCQHFTAISDLQDKLFQEVWRYHSELMLLFEGTTADILISGQDWQPCSIRLRPSFELLLDFESSICDDNSFSS
jgi:hypothetical protein